jgi:hypothetical protein
VFLTDNIDRRAAKPNILTVNVYDRFDIPVRAIVGNDYLVGQNGLTRNAEQRPFQMRRTVITRYN